MSSENDEAVMDDVHSISSEASLTDNIPNLVTSETSLGQLQSKIESKSKKILENFVKMKIFQLFKKKNVLSIRII